MSSVSRFKHHNNVPNECRFRSTRYHRSIINPQYRSIYDDLVSTISSGGLELKLNCTLSDCPNPTSLRRILTGLLNDNPHIFWINDSIVMGRCGDEVSVMLQSNELYDDRENLTRDIWKECNKMLSMLSKDGVGDYNASLSIHDMLVEKVHYKDSNDSSSHSVIGPILYSEGVCDGISDTYNILMNMAGVKCTTVKGHTHNSTVGHSWNVSILDNHAYHTDVTFDLGGSHRFLNLDDDSMSLTHRFRRHISCDSMVLNYHVINGTLFNTVDDADYFLKSSKSRNLSDIEFMVLEPSDNDHFLEVILSSGRKGRWTSTSSEDGRGFRLKRVGLSLFGN